MDLEPDVMDAVIAAGQSVSGAVDLQLDRLHRIDMPAGWDAASLTLLASHDGITFSSLFTETAEYVITAAGAGRSIWIDPGLAYGIRWLQLRSGTAAAPVNQTAERTFKLATVPR
jgi:hypothetical protein